MLHFHEVLRRSTALALAASLMLSVLPAAAASEVDMAAQPIMLTEGEPAPQPLDPEGEPAPQPLDPDGEPVVLPTDPDGEPVTLPTDPDDDAVVLPEDPDDDTDLPTGGGTPVITWPDPDETEELPDFLDHESANIAAQAAHTCSWTESVRVPATCENDGYVIYTCPGYSYKIFGKVIHVYCLPKTTTLPKLTHDWGEWETTKNPQCEVDGEESRTCKRDASHVDKRPITALVHLWDDGTFSSPYECVDRVKTQKCTRGDCQGTKETDIPASVEHQYAWKTTKAPSCTEPGEEKYICVCGTVRETKAIAPLGGDHELTHVVEPAACLENGCEYDLCSRCHYKYNEEVLPYPGHTAGVWKDQDKPGCCVQEFKTNCTVCDAEMTKTSPALREHKFSRYVLSGVDAKAVCDYCGIATKTIEITAGNWNDFLASTGQVAAATGSTLASDYIAGEATKAINDVLADTKAKVNAAQTKEEAIAALDAVYEDTLEKVLDIRYVNDDLNLNIGLTQAQAEKLLKDLKDTMEDLQAGLSKSFLSKESVQDVVSKIVETTNSDEGVSITKKTTYELVFGEVYDTLGGPEAPAVDSSLDKLILQLAQTATADDAYWDTLTESLVDDLLGEALKGLRGDKLADQVGGAVAEAIKDALPYSLMGLWFGDVVGGFTTDAYRMYTSSEQFEELFDEVGDVVRDQLANDPTFVNDVRQIVEKAAARAKEGVSKGWTEEKIYANLRSDLSGVDQLVNDRVTSLGDDAAVLLEEKVAETIKDALPYNVFGLWLGDSLGGFTNDLVNIAAEKGGKSISDTIRDYIRYYTCPKHQLEKFVVSEASCTGAKVLNERCALCGWVEDNFTTEGDPLGHAVVTDAAVEPTQLADGQTEGSHCARCGEVFVKQQSIPMLDPEIYVDSEYHRAITEADALALGYASLEDLNAALDDAVRAAGFDPANSIRFTAQINSSIGILPNDRFPSSGAQTLLPIPDATAQEYYAVQVYTADVQSTNFHPAGEFAVTPVKRYADSLGLDLYTQAIVILAWKA